MSAKHKTLTFKSNTLKTLEEVLKEAKVDLDIWEVKNYRINKWDVSARTAKRNGWNTTELWQVKIDLQRKIPEKHELVIKKLLTQFKNYKPKYVKPPKAKPNQAMLELSLFDVHFGKLAWGLETGTNYDSDIASRLFSEAIQDLLYKSQSFNIGHILLPIGNDFFNCDNWTNTTNRGTPQDVDGRFQKIFETGFDSCVQAIDRCLKIAPVEIIWVPGNHDMETSWYLTRVLQAHYHGCPDVVVNTLPATRKYKIYGPNLIGFTHGNEERFAALPNIMAAEVPHLWAQSEYRVWHVGHFHKRKEMSFTKSDTFNGVRIEILPSLSGTDKWHYQKGYVKNIRAAEAHIWSQDGPVGYLVSNVRDWV